MIRESLRGLVGRSDRLAAKFEAGLDDRLERKRKVFGKARKRALAMVYSCELDNAAIDRFGHHGAPAFGYADKDPARRGDGLYPAVVEAAACEGREVANPATRHRSPVAIPAIGSSTANPMLRSERF